MRIIILGAGRVGESVAESMVSEQNDITVIDPNLERLRGLEERLDLRGVPGNGIQPSVLRRADAEDADMFIACASLDETNLTACKVAHDVFNIPTTIARLRSPEFKALFPAATMQVVAIYRQDAELHVEPGTRVLPGDAADEDLLIEESVGEMDLFISLTSDDEDNTIDIALSPAQTVIGELLTHVRRGAVWRHRARQGPRLRGLDALPRPGD